MAIAVLSVLCIILFALSLALFAILYRNNQRFKQAFDIEQGTFLDMQEVINHFLKQKEAIDFNISNKSFEARSTLSDAIREVVKLAYKLINAKYVELTLKDSDTDMYHSACSMGNPVVGDNGNYQVIEEPILFANKTLGLIKIIVDREVEFSLEDQKLLKIITLQAGLAILNAEYSKELIRFKLASEESVKAKTGFLANLSHEIRGPLSIILNATEFVLDGICGEISDQQKRTLDMVKKNGDHLLDLISDVLNYAKVEAGKVKPNFEYIQVDDMLQDIVKLVNSQVRTKRHRLVFTRNKTDSVISVDRKHLRQMLINILTNAIKYTPEGGCIEIWSEQTPSNRVQINIKDDGVGISDQNKLLVFSAFERVAEDYSKRQAGTGIGMPLTKKLAEINKARVDFDSVEGQGSHFWLVFDSQDPDKLNTEEDQDELLVTGNGENILVLEPDLREAEMIEKYLSKLGFKVNVETSLEHLGTYQEDTDLIIIENIFLDNGSENFIANLRAMLKTEAPLILLSSKAFEFDIEHYLKMGVDLCLTKPISLKELSCKARVLLKN